MCISCFAGILNASSSIQPISGEKQGWNILTENAVYQLQITDNGTIVPLFWGTKALAEQTGEQDRLRHNGPFVLQEVPVREIHADKMPILEVVYADHTP